MERRTPYPQCRSISRASLTFDNATPILFDEVSKLGALPDISIEAEEYFTDLVAAHDSEDSRRRHLKSHLPELYPCLGHQLPCRVWRRRQKWN